MKDKLYIRITGDDISFAIGKQVEDLQFSVHRLDRRVSFTINLRRAVEAEPLTKLERVGVDVIVSGAVIAVPLSDFREEDCEPLYDSCFRPAHKHRVFYDTLPTANVVLLYALDDSCCRAIKEKFGKVIYISEQTARLRRYSMLSATASAKRIFLHLVHRKLEMSTFEGTRLLMLNTYDTKNADDVCYYTLSVMQALGMSPAEGTLVLLEGEKMACKQAKKVLEKFVGEITELKEAGSKA